jgi:nitrite reductase/ring-hydroxylating ferredoxin subunit/alkylhydroperoxidase/carboxymuconolactone decarboxylase family protein YurZ
MSDALDYLQRVRPEAMTHYFAFLKGAGAGLDPKTRAIISLITKVAAQTERGFAQYLRRALDAGVSANEVLDALLLALPVLGFSKIVWAVDQLLALGLPEFRVDPEAAPHWRPIGPLAALPLGVSRHRVVDRDALLVRDEEGVRAYDARCPHQGTVIPAGAADGDRIVCPRHGWTFALADGHCEQHSGAALRRFPIRVLDDVIEIGWAPGP